MVKKKEKQTVALLLFLLVATFFVYNTSSESVKVTKKQGLMKLLGPVEGYTVSYSSALDEDVSRFLELDDYTNTGYERNNEQIGLYIGYYYTLDKVSAAHSPLVCFPGQGWTIDQPEEFRLELASGAIQYSEIVAKLEGRQELIMFWYQAGERTAIEVYKNKVNAMLNKLFGKKQEHAFVRVSVSLAHLTREEGRKVGDDFIKAFYPTFLSYIRNE